jgi:hypothetical protein
VADNLSKDSDGTNQPKRSARGKDILPGINATWSREYKNEFSGTSISVVIMVADKV